MVARDFPFLGACYGIGTLGVHQGATIDRTYREPISVVEVTLTEAGASDPLLDGMPRTFNAFVGHKEAISELPPFSRAARLVADVPGADVPRGRECVRDAVPSRAGCRRHHEPHPSRTPTTATSRPHELDLTLAAVRRAEVSHPSLILSNFVERYAR